MSSKRNVKYEILVKFRNANTEKALGKQRVQYFLGQGNEDDFDFKKTKFVLIAYRSRMYSISEICYQPNNNIQTQILKGIMMFCANCRTFPLIASINVTTTCAKVTNTFAFDNYLQLFNTSLQRADNLFFTPTKEFFQENEKGQKLRIALSHWEKAINSADLFARFDKLWTAINALYSYYGKTHIDAIGQEYLISELIRIQNNLPITIDIAKHYSRSDIRHSFRWVLYGRNIRKRNKTNSFFGYLKTVQDQRVKELFTELLIHNPLRDIFVEEAEYTNVINTLAVRGIDYPMDVLVLLAIKYAYYLRCRKQHGDILECTFKLCETSEDREYRLISEFLSVLLCEIFKNISILQQKQ